MNVKPIGTTKQVDKNLKILKRLCSQNVLIHRVHGLHTCISWNLAID